MSSYQVAIIGAGVSGLKAAHTLLNDPESTFKPEDIVVLEAQDHIGGRINTDRTQSKLGKSYDLGAAWFHDSLTNSVLHDAIKANDKESFDLTKDSYFDDKESKLYASENGNEPVDSVGLKLDRVLEDLHKYIELCFTDSIHTKDLPLFEIADKFFDKYSMVVTEKQKDYCRRMLPYLEGWYGIPWDKISGKYSVMDHQGRNLINTKGYDFVIQKLSSEISNATLKCNFQVKEINTSNKDNDKKISLTSSHSETIYANYVIVTVPQSILALDKTHKYGLTWTPPLPERVADAIHTVHFAALGKVIFEFDNVWWDVNEDRFEILPDKGNDIELGKPLSALPPSFSYYAHVINYAAHNASTVVAGGSLGILTSSPLTEYLESHPDEAWAYFKPMLSRLVNKGEAVTDPINVITTDWTKNPYIRGSYTALEVGDDPNDLIIQLSGEYDGCGISSRNVRFAGEHTIADGAGCVHGAYDSGHREAKHIIEQSK